MSSVDIGKVFDKVPNRVIEWSLRKEGVSKIIGTFSNDDGSKKLHFLFALFFFVRVIRVLFLCFKFCE